jgi:dimethylglycine dehydrogenase
VEATDADAAGFEPVWGGSRRVGFVTSGGYGHTIGKSLAMAYVDREPPAGLEVHIVGAKRKCQKSPPSPYDPQGKLLRS